MAAFETDQTVIDWLMEGDPAIRWQVQRDLLGEPPKVFEAEQARVAEEGWGARLLAEQDPEGSWAGGIYTPKFTSTHYTLLALRRLGLPPGHPAALKACRHLFESPPLVNIGEGFPTSDKHQADICVVGMTLNIMAWFGVDDERVHMMARHLIGNRMADEGWNCRHWRGATHSSFHSTCSVLEGLLTYQRAYPKSDLPLEGAQAAGREFFLIHRLYKSHRTGEVVKEQMTRFPYLPQWNYDFLKGLDYFQDAGAPTDERASDAIELLLSRRDGEGRWPQYRSQSGKFFFILESPSKPSRGNTLRALRVLKWWQDGDG